VAQLVTPPTQELDALLEEMEKRERAAFTMVVALCKDRRESGAREWIMSIPARPDYDPDLVIAAALRDVRRLTLALREALSRLKESNQAGGLSAFHCDDLAAITAKLRGED
jgi:hypothetical protein